MKMPILNASFIKNIQLPNSLTPAIVVISSFFYTAIILFLILLTVAPGASAKSETEFSNVSHAQRCATAALAAARFDFVGREAIKHCNMAIRTEPLRENDLAVTYNNRGVLYKKKNRLDKALIDYYSARNINRDMAVLYVNIGNVFYGEQDFEKAINYYDKAIAEDANIRASARSAALTNRGMANEKLYRLATAIHDYKAALSIDANADLAAHRLQLLSVGGQASGSAAQHSITLDGLVGL